MKKCSNCGLQTNDNEKICPVCGNRLSNNKNINKLAIIISLSIVFVMTFFCLGIYNQLKKNTDQEYKPYDFDASEFNDNNDIDKPEDFGFDDTNEESNNSNIEIDISEKKLHEKVTFEDYNGIASLEITDVIIPDYQLDLDNNKPDGRYVLIEYEYTNISIDGYYETMNSDFYAFDNNGNKLKKVYLNQPANDGNVAPSKSGKAYVAYDLISDENYIQLELHNSLCGAYCDEVYTFILEW